MVRNYHVPNADWPVYTSSSNAAGLVDSIASTTDDLGRARVDDLSISVVIPAKNEESGLQKILPAIRQILPGAEIVVVDSGSSDATAQVAIDHGARVVRQPYAYGNGAAVKAGIRSATRPCIVLMDADGQHDPADIPALLERFSIGYDMVVGARAAASQASLARRIANGIYNRLASWIVNRRIDDLTSGFRVVRADYARDFLYLLPNGFSYPATITLAFFRSGYSVDYYPIRALSREGKSHINPVRDGARFFLIIFKIGTLYSPLKVFVPVSLMNFFVGLAYYAYTYHVNQRLTNMTVILISIASLIFMIGLLSEQITNLYYGLRERQKQERDE